MQSSDLCRDFLRGAGHSEAPPEIVSLVEALLPVGLENARQGWPALNIGDEIVVARLAEVCLASGLKAEQLPGWLSALYLGDLFLVCAVELNVQGAVAVFAQKYVAPAVRSVRMKRAADELVQMVLERLLVAEDGRPPRLHSYSGKGSLTAWVKVVAARISINERAQPNLFEKVSTVREIDDLSATILGPDIELAILSSQYRDSLRLALAAALGALSSRDRNVLRFYFLEGVSGDSLARMYGVSRRTVTRWIEDSRSAVLLGIRKKMEIELKLSGEELEALIGALRSQLASVLHLGLDDGNR